MRRLFHKLGFSLILCFWLFTPNVIVQADIAPPEPPKGSDITPGSATTNVRMVSEKVLIEVAAKSSHPTGEAAITADFQMHNLGQVEEKMYVRFPLCNVMTWDSSQSWNYLPEGYKYPPIDHFTARVDGVAAKVFNTPIQPDEAPDWDQPDKNAPCWANFPVAFSPGQDVQIEVHYNQIGYGGYEHGSLNYVKYTYILFTGAAWKDTIGSADVIVRLPMQAGDDTVIEHPQDAVFAGQEIRWRAEDFEPGKEKGIITVGILQPAYWTAIQKESLNVAANPKDGEAWGRLGKAYKAATMMEHGWRRDPAGLTLAQKSRDAYQHAVDLLPKDADWHYGFADLLCSDVIWNAFNNENQTEQLQYNQMCVQQLNLALQLNPKHPQANDLLQTMINMNLMKSSPSGMIYLLLTPQPTMKIGATETAVSDTPTPTQPVPPTTVSPTLAPTQIIPPATTTPAVIKKNSSINTPTPARSLPPFCGGFIALGSLIVLLMGWHLKK